jgi:hypothetical protein
MQMPGKSNEEFLDRLADGKLIGQALQRAVRQALWRHKLLGFPIAVARDGAVKWIAPADIPVSPEDKPGLDASQVDLK